MLSVLILSHELGHYICARIFKVKIHEFSVGMGPKLLQIKSKKNGIAYSLRLFPIGGYVSMLGEDEEVETPDSLSSKPVWQRLIITAAGAIVNIATGFIIMLFVVACTSKLGGTTVAEFIPQYEEITDANQSKDYPIVTSEDGKQYWELPAASQEAGLLVGDHIIKVGHTPVHTLNELSYELMFQGESPIKLTVKRGNDTVVIDRLLLPTETEDGIVFGMRDFYVKVEDKTLLTVCKHAFFRSCSTIKMVWDSLLGLITGRFGVRQMSGPVGVTTVVSEAAKTSAIDFWYLVCVIAINLGVMNLLPLPALDGGRILFQLIELITRKKVPAHFEGMVHFVGIVILLGFSVFITFQDIFKLFQL